MEGSFLGGLAACAMLAFYLCSGYVAAACLLTGERWVVRLWIGAALGLLMLMWLPALFAFILRFSIAAHIAALVCCALMTAALYLWRRPSLRPEATPKWGVMALCVLPMTVLTTYLIVHHTLRPVDGALHTGQSGFGDMSMHLGFVTSLARQGTFPPEYSILPGVKLGYPFLCDSISASLYLLGAPLRLAYALPSAAAMFLCFLGYYLLMETWLGDCRKAALAFALFFLGGGLGFAYFFEGLRDNPYNFTRMLTAFYETPTNLMDENIRWVNPVADMMLPQRATLFGWTMLLPCLYLLQRLAFEKGQSAILLGVFAGALPMVHTHSFLALGLLSAALLIYVLVAADKLREVARAWLPYALIALALALPQLLAWTFAQAAQSGFIRLHLNWVNEQDNALWFYIKNIGLVFLLVLPAALGTPGKRRVLWLCSLPLWLIAEVIVFQPNEYDNNKLLFIVHMLSCGLVAGWLVDVYRRVSGLGGRRVAAALVLALGTLSGVLTLWREAVSDYELFSADQVAAARYIDKNLPIDALLLTGDQHNNAPAALSGRNIVYGSEAYLYFHGVSDDARNLARFLMLTSPTQFRELAPGYDVTHVYLSSFERREGAYDEVFEGCPLIYQQGEVSIYVVSPKDP